MKIKSLLVVLPILFWLRSGYGANELVPVSDEFQVNSHVDSDQTMPSVGMDSQGNFVVTWTSLWQDGSRNGIFAQRFNKDREKLGEEFRVNTYTEEFQWFSDIAVDTEGNFIITWQGTNEYGYPDIRAQKFNSLGERVGDEFIVSVANTERDAYYYPKIATDSKGNFVIVWVGGYFFLGENVNNIYVQRFDKNCNRLEDPILVDSDGYLPNVAIDPDGNFVVVWQSEHNIFAQRFENNGNSFKEQILVDVLLHDELVRPAIAMNANGNFVITWVNTSGDDPGGDIYTQLFDVQGNRLSGKSRVNIHLLNLQRLPSVVLASNDNWILAWSGFRQEELGEELFMQLFNREGQKAGEEQRVNIYSQDDQICPSLAMNQNGNIIITWSSLFQDGSAFGIYARQYQLLEGFLSGDANGDNSVNIADAISILMQVYLDQPVRNASAADVDSNGMINRADAIYLLEYLFMNGPAPRKK